MNRMFGSDSGGRAFDEATVQRVWEKATIVPGSDSTMRRKDACGAWIYRPLYNFTLENSAGWEIDHIVPVSRGGTDDLENLQPLCWTTNREKADRYPWRARRRTGGPTPPYASSSLPI